MKKNMGSLDKNIRLFMGVVIISIGYLNQSWWGTIGLVFILTALISWCPAYVPFKFSTIKNNNKK
ncbi:MAG: DUF2892 domain-containing protein [Ignavibacteriales bacterium]|nr:DUF2892 domain-containing protein [Ignavibacteriota bacterium]MCB0748285.1 DUF2892 domain-containing protein [Ignavibacteriota bacterium]MCB9247823.1 DUF2892 domain-containing protein [Ignavibacteriales bacterium]